MKFFQTIFRLIGLSAMAAVGGLLSSCNGLIYDDAEDCTPTYQLRFRYDMNLKWADAFAHEVKSVRVHAYDDSGNLVKIFTDKGLHLSAEGYSVNLSLPAGKYRLIAWCGTDNDAQTDGRGESFSISHYDVPGFVGGAEESYKTEAVIGSHIDSMACALNYKVSDEKHLYSDEHLYALFHGDLNVELPDADDGGVYTFTMPLTKDTNHIRVILNHLRHDVDVSDYTFYVEDSNGRLDADNNLLPAEEICYHTWKLQNGSVNLVNPSAPVETRASILTTASGAIADMTVGRMMVSHRDKMMLTIKNKTGATVATLPVIDYALLAKDYYEDVYGQKMTDQEFLDREDNYVITLFLDEGHDWSQANIFIHSWRVVKHDYDI